MHTQGEHANSIQKGPSQDSNQEPSFCEVTVLTTTPLCSPKTISSFYFNSIIKLTDRQNVSGELVDLLSVFWTTQILTILLGIFFIYCITCIDFIV